jgi:hypothetical protein
LARPFKINHGITTDVWEDVALSNLDEGELTVVAVGKEIWNKWLDTGSYRQR